MYILLTVKFVLFVKFLLNCALSERVLNADNNNSYNGRYGSYLRGWQPQMRETQMVCHLQLYHGD